MPKLREPNPILIAARKRVHEYVDKSVIDRGQEAYAYFVAQQINAGNPEHDWVLEHHFKKNNVFCDFAREETEQGPRIIPVPKWDMIADEFPNVIERYKNEARFQKKSAAEICEILYQENSKLFNNVVESEFEALWKVSGFDADLGFHTEPPSFPIPLADSHLTKTEIIELHQLMQTYPDLFSKLELPENTEITPDIAAMFKQPCVNFINIKTPHLINIPTFIKQLSSNEYNCEECAIGNIHLKLSNQGATYLESLHGRHYTDEDHENILIVLKHSKALKEITINHALSRTQLSDLVTELKNQSELKSLAINIDNLGAQSAKIMVQLIEQHPMLENISIKMNIRDLTPDEAQYTCQRLITKLDAHNNILSFNSNFFSLDTQEIIQAQLQQNTIIKAINSVMSIISDNTDAIERYIQQHFAQYRRLGAGELGFWSYDYLISSIRHLTPNAEAYRDNDTNDFTAHKLRLEILAYCAIAARPHPDNSKPGLVEKLADLYLALSSELQYFGLNDLAINMLKQVPTSYCDYADIAEQLFGAELNDYQNRNPQAHDIKSALGGTIEKMLYYSSEFNLSATSHLGVSLFQAAHQNKPFVDTEMSIDGESDENPLQTPELYLFIQILHGALTSLAKQYQDQSHHLDKEFKATFINFFMKISSLELSEEFTHDTITSLNEVLALAPEILTIIKQEDFDAFKHLSMASNDHGRLTHALEALQHPEVQRFVNEGLNFKAHQPIASASQ